MTPHSLGSRSNASNARVWQSVSTCAYRKQGEHQGPKRNHKSAARPFITLINRSCEAMCTMTNRSKERRKNLCAAMVHGGGEILDFPAAFSEDNFSSQLMGSGGQPPKWDKTGYDIFRVLQGIFASKFITHSTCRPGFRLDYSEGISQCDMGFLRHSLQSTRKKNVHDIQQIDLR